MPKVTYRSMTKQADPLVVLIFGRASALGIRLNELAEKAHMSDDTLRRKKRNPKLFTLGDLGYLCRALDIKIDEIRPVIRL